MAYYPKHKYHAKPTTIDDIYFHSKKEAKYYQLLTLLQKQGSIVFFLRQVPLHLPGGVKMVVDFVEFREDGTVHFVDVKGFKTKQYIDKKKLVEAHFPIKIEEV